MVISDPRHKDCSNLTDAPHLILLDATYKTTKYALSLYFLIVKENVSCQVCINKFMVN